MKMINVACCVFPDASVLWTRDIEHGPGNAIDTWRAELSEKDKERFASNHATAGCVIVRMSEATYGGIHPTHRIRPQKTTISA